jgi:hypothetical protein
MTALQERGTRGTAPGIANMSNAYTRLIESANRLNPQNMAKKPPICSAGEMLIPTFASNVKVNAPRLLESGELPGP